ncbi:MAG: aldehyde dehydrogenase family protein [Candidatus Limnocylindrales bacterium]
MTTDAKPRIKITYATLRADNEELHSGFEEALARVRPNLGGTSPQLHRWRLARRSGHVRGALADRPRHRPRHLRDRDRGRRGRCGRRRACGPAGLGGHRRGESRLEILRRAADLISDRLMDDAAMMAIEVGKNRVEALGEVEESADLIRYYAQTMEDNDGYDRPMGNLGDETVHTRSILQPARRVRGRQPVQLPDGPRRRADVRGADGRQHGRAQARVTPRRCRRSSCSRRTSTPACPTASSTSSWARARRSARRSRITPGIDGIVFTGSYEVGHGAVPDVLEGLAAAVHRRDGRQEPGHRHPPRRPRRGRRGDHALRVRVRRPEVLGQLAGLRRARRCTTSSSAMLVEKTEGDRHRRPARPRENWLGPVIDERAVERHQTAVAEARRDGDRLHRRRAPDRRRPCARLLRRADRRRRPAGRTTGSSATSCSRRSRRSTRSTRSTRRSTLANDSIYGLTAGVYSARIRPEVQTFLDRIQAGVVYVNRRAGATTGAWPGIQAFGGWKGSGSTGKARPLDVLRRAIPAGAEPHRRRLTPGIADPVEASSGSAILPASLSSVHSRYA